MIDKNVSLDLMEFIETEILPRYANFDQAHRLSHVNNVIRQSLDLARKIGADINMAYAIAAYHDLGLEGPSNTSCYKRKDSACRQQAATMVLHRQD